MRTGKFCLRSIGKLIGRPGTQELAMSSCLLGYRTSQQMDPQLGPLGVVDSPPWAGRPGRGITGGSNSFSGREKRLGGLNWQCEPPGWPWGRPFPTGKVLGGFEAPCLFISGIAFCQVWVTPCVTPISLGLFGQISSPSCLIPYTPYRRSAPFCSFLFSVLRGLPPCCWTVMCFVVFTFHSLDHTSSRLFDSFLFFAELNTLGASPVPSPSCEVPPEHGHKVLEAGTCYPWVETAKFH